MKRQKVLIYKMKYFCFLIFGFFTNSPLYAYTYDFIEFPDSGDTPRAFTFVNGINNHGHIVGTFRNDESGQYGFVLKNDIYNEIKIPESSWIDVTGINDSGYIVGSYGYPLTNYGYGFIYDGDTFVTLSHPDAISDVGFFAGTRVQSINNLGQIVGNYGDTSGNTQAFMYDDGNWITITPPDSEFTVASGVNNLGEVVGYFLRDGIYRGFFYDGNDFSIIENPESIEISSPGTVITSINDFGIMTGHIIGIGEYYDQSFIYDGISFRNFDVPGSVYVRTTDLNNNGQITGWINFLNPDPSGRIFNGFLATPINQVSEPSIVLIVLLGTGLFFLFRRNITN